MKIEQQVVSLELAKKLRELGVKQESMFTWIPVGNESVKGWILRQTEGVGIESYAAFTVAELGALLTSLTTSGKTVQEGKVVYQGKEWNCHCPYPNRNEYAETEADARAKMLIYLIEHNLITP